MPQDPLDQSNPHILARLMSLGDDQQPDWQSGDLAPIMAHQLRASLEFDLSRCAPEKRAYVQEILLRDGAELLTFGDLLSHPKPPVELLRQAKDFARSRYEDPKRPLPPKVATMLYYACIAAARVRLNERITDLSDSDLGTGLGWAIGQKWIDSTLRALLSDCLSQLRSGG